MYSYKEAAREVAYKNGIKESTAIKCYMYFFKFIRSKITEMPLKEIETAEEFEKLRPNFNIPSLGKLYVTEDRFLALKKKYNETKEKYGSKDKENQADVYQDDCNG